ncbi:MAG: glutamate--cysteine ligase [Fibrobacteres bacterium]|nr:glutamate--cysteine ligase [Fibrobacterota bacterium]
MQVDSGSAASVPVSAPASYSLFEVFGVEIEYAVVRKDTLAVDPSADRLLAALGGSPDSHPAAGNVEADNELAAHVLELKCKVPARDLAAQARDFAAYVKLANQALSQWNCRLMPGGMHPFMDPTRESRIWPHEDSGIYESYHRVFGVRGHGWFNIQSVHLNLPFAGDAEFSRLHNAISLLLPMLPALAASSPVHDGAHHGWLDGRLSHYIGNQRRLPSIIGDIVPEAVGSEEEYREKILAPMFREIAPFDSQGILQEEWLNSRAAIARFDRDTIEIRCLDTQERPTADLALCHWITSMLRYAMGTGEDMLAAHRKVPAGLLRALFLDTAKRGMMASVPPEFPFAAFGVDRQSTTGAFIKALSAKSLAASRTAAADQAFMPSIGLILSEGNLAERILRAAPQPAGYPAVYARLCDCLEEDKPFSAA